MRYDDLGDTVYRADDEESAERMMMNDGWNGNGMENSQKAINEIKGKQDPGGGQESGGERAEEQRKRDTALRAARQRMS